MKTLLYYFALIVFIVLGIVVPFFGFFQGFGFYNKRDFHITIGVLVILLILWPIIFRRSHAFETSFFCYLNLLIGIFLSYWYLVFIAYIIGIVTAVRYMVKFKQSFFTLISCIGMYLLFGFIRYLADNFSETKVVQTIWSCDKNRKIEIISKDEGALGGSTYVMLRERHFIFFSKNRRVYDSEYDDYPNVSNLNCDRFKISNRHLDRGHPFVPIADTIVP